MPSAPPSDPLSPAGRSDLRTEEVLQLKTLKTDQNRSVSPSPPCCSHTRISDRLQGSTSSSTGSGNIAFKHTSVVSLTNQVSSGSPAGAQFHPAAAVGQVLCPHRPYFL